MQESWFYTLTNNSTFAIIIGFLALITSYFIWRSQHTKELKDKYFSEYLRLAYNFFSLKQSEINFRKELNKEYWRYTKGKKTNDKYEGLIPNEEIVRMDSNLNFLNMEEIQNDGKIRTKKFLLKQLSDKRWEEIEKTRRKFIKKFKKFSKIVVKGKDSTRPDVYEVEIKNINEKLDKYRKELFEFIDEKK